MKKFEVIINNLLKEMGYGEPHSILSNEYISICVFKNEDIEKTQYYVVSECNNIYFQGIDFEELQEDIYKGIKELFVQEPEIEKNTSWLIGVDCEDGYEDLMEKILSIEENPYYFKKMVCPYTQKEVEGFMNEIEDDVDYIGYIQQEVAKVNRFADFHEDKDSVYSFLSRLLIKIPSIELPIIKEKEIGILSNDIDKAIQENDLEEIHRFLRDNIDEKINMLDDNVNALHDLYFKKGEDYE